MRFKSIGTVIATLLIVLAVPVLAFAQGANPTPERPFYYSTAGIALATSFVVSGLKRAFGNVDGLNKIPTWVYACAVSVALTALAAYGLKTISVETTMIDLLYQSALSAATASGGYEWFFNSTKTLKSSARSAGVKITDVH